MRDPLVETHPTRRPLQALASRACNRPQDRRATRSHRRILWTVLLALLSWIGGSPGLADEISKEQMQGLDDQVQVIKSDVLGIAAELNRLEEKLLYPSNTQVAVFVSLAEGQSFRLDSVQIQIDGESVAHHIYAFNELEALQKGGVQRIYTGNLPTGEHRLEVSIAGKLPGGGDFGGTESFAFRKNVEPKVVGITLAERHSGDPGIEIGPW